MRALDTGAPRSALGPGWRAACLTWFLSAVSAGCAGPYVPPPWPGPSNPERVKLHARRAARLPEPGRGAASQRISLAPEPNPAPAAAVSGAGFVGTPPGRGALYLQAYDVRLGTLPIRSSAPAPMQLGIPGFEPEPEPEQLPDPAPLVMSEDQLVDLIVELVEPDSWDEEGVSLRAANGLLFVRNTAQAQRGVSTLLRRLGF